MEDINWREKSKELLVENIGEDINICTRVWEAWGVGTMTEDDFHLANEDAGFINDLSDMMIKFAKLACEEQKKICAEHRVTEYNILNAPTVKFD